MDWTTQLEAVRQAVITCTGLQDFTGASGTVTVQRVSWVNKPEAARWAQGAIADLELGSITNEVRDETRYEYDADGDKNVPTVSGWRRVSLSVRIMVDSQADSSSAPTLYSGRLRTRMRRDGVIEALAAAGVTIVGVGPTVVSDFEEPNTSRIWSAAVVDLDLRITEWDTDTEDDGDYIQTVEAEYEFDGREGDLTVTS